MDVRDALDKLEESGIVKQFLEKNPEYHLAHVFSMHAPGTVPDFQFGFYSPLSKRIVVFKTQPIEQLPEDKTFSRSGKIKALTLADVKLDCAAAEKIALDLKSSLAPAENVTKVVLVLQHLDVQVYNITLVTSTFNIINIRIDAASSEVISKDMRSIMSLRLEEKPKK